MKNILLYSFLILFFFQTSLGYGSVKKTHMVKQEYKRALDAGADAAVKHHTYVEEDDLEGIAQGFGDGYDHTNNIPLNKADSLKWFYRIFHSDIGIDDSDAIMDSFKQYIPMKCLVEFDQISIADGNDSWVINDRKYIIGHNGKDYLFTLSDQVLDITTNEWTTDTEIGLTTKARQALVAEFINDEIETFINNSGDIEEQFTFELALHDEDPSLNRAKGSNFIVFVEGMPIPSMNLHNPTQKFHAFAIGGSQIERVGSE